MWKGAKQTSYFHRDALREHIHRLPRHHAMLAQPPSPPTQPYKPIAIAAIDIPLLTSATRSIVDNRLHSDSRADFDIADVVANGFDVAAEFVAEGEGYLFVRDRMGGRGHYVGAAEVFVEV